MPLIGIAFDYNYYVDTANLGDVISWDDAFQHYLSEGSYACKPPNLLDPLYNSYIAKQEDESCQLEEAWSITISSNETSIIISQYFDRELEQKFRLFKNNLSYISLNSTDELENLAIATGDAWKIKNSLNLFFNHALIKLSNITDYISNEKIADRIIFELTNNRDDNHFIKKFSKSATSLLTTYAVTHEANSTQLEYLTNFIKKDDLSPIIKGHIFEAFSNKTDYLGNNNDTEIINQFANLLPYDNEEHTLAKALLTAGERFNYTAPDETTLLEFEKLLDDGNLRGSATDLISNSLVKFLHEEKISLDVLEQRSTKLFAKTAHLKKNLVSEIFDSFSKQQGYFGKLIIDMLAEDKGISKSILPKLIAPISQLENKKSSLFIALRLAQHKVELPNELIINLLPSLQSDDSGERTLAIDLLSNIELENDFLKPLTQGFSNLSEYEQGKITALISNSKLLDEQLDNYQFCQKTTYEDEFLKHSVIEKLTKASSLLLISQIENLKQNLNWSLETLSIPLLSWPDMQIVQNIFEKLSDYSVNSLMTNRYGSTAEEIIKTSDGNKDALERISQLITDNHFFLPYDLNGLLKEFKEINHNNKLVLELIESGYFEEQLSKMESAKVQLGVNKWENSQFAQWRHNIQEINYNDLGEVLAVVSEAIFRTIANESWYPRDIQLLSVLMMMHFPEGGVSQIGTGEGKSIINAIFATIKVIQGHKVDIITSSKTLVERDVEELHGFYNLLGISIAHNLQSKQSLKECYKVEILYGDLLNFIGDDLRDRSTNTKYSRPYDIIIIDEVDNPLIDLNNMKIQLSSTIPGFETLEQVFVHMWAEMHLLNSFVKLESDGCYNAIDLTKALKNKENQSPAVNTTNHVQERQYLGEDCRQVILDNIRKFSFEEMFDLHKHTDNRSIVLPKHLLEYARNQFENWLESLEASFSFHNKLDYLVYKSPDTSQNRYNFTIIAPLDAKNSGEILTGLQWSNGLHPILQLKHMLTMLPENIVSIYKSYFGYFSQFKGGIYGVTGTLGNDAHHDFLKEIYGADSSKVPNFIRKDIVEFPTIIANDIEDWETAITDTLHRKIKDSRAALIVVETVAGAEYCRDLIIESCYDPSHVFTYGIGGDQESKLFSKELQSGDVVIATNLGGRGTDIKISPEVRKAGGLHVILGYLPDSVRIQDQAYGRAARKGEPGSSQLIIVSDEENCDIECLKDKRDNQEISRLQTDTLCHLPLIKLRDDLYDGIQSLINDVNSPTGLILQFAKPDTSGVYAPSMFVYQDDDKLFLTIVDEQKAATLDISEILPAIDINAYKHIYSIVSNPTPNPTSLNKQDYEILHFIAASAGYSKIESYINRVNNDFNSSVKKEATQSYTNVAKSWVYDAKSPYLKKLLRTEGEYSDLLDESKIQGEETEKILNKVELRKKYSLWNKYRDIYNDQYEIQEITVRFGIWLREIDVIFEKFDTCTITDVETSKQLYSDIRKEAFEKFNELRTEIQLLAKNKTIIENPATYTKKAWRNLAIHVRNSDASPMNSKAKQEESTIGSYFSGAVKYIADTTWNIATSKLEYDFGNDVITNPLGEAISYLNKAKELDDAYSWPAETTLAVINLVKDRVNVVMRTDARLGAEAASKYIDYNNKALAKINRYVIPDLETRYATLLTHGGMRHIDDQAIQLEHRIQVFKVIAKKIESNIHFAQTVSYATHGLKVESMVNLNELTKNIDITKSITDRINATGTIDSLRMNDLYNSLDHLKSDSRDVIIGQIENAGGFLYELGTYDLLKEEKSWWGTLFAAAIGIVAIASGVGAIMCGLASTVFTTSLSISLVGIGTGALITVGTAVHNGQPIDFGDFIKSQGISLAIAVITAGTLSYIDHLAKTYESLKFITEGIDVYKGTRTLAEAAKIVAPMVAGMAAIEGLGIVAANAAKRTIDKKDIVEDAKDKFSAIFAEFEDELRLIFATDELKENGAALYKILEHDLITAIDSHSKKFREDGLQIGLGVGSNVVGSALGGIGVYGKLLGSAISAGVHAGMGFHKSAEALNKIASKIRNSIQTLAKMAMSSDEIFKSMLQIQFQEEANALYTAMGQSYSQCAKIAAIEDTGSLNGYDVATTCNDVKKLLEKQSFDNLLTTMTTLVSGHVYTTKRAATDSAARAAANLAFQASGGADVLWDKLQKSFEQHAEAQAVSGGKKSYDDVAKKAGFGTKAAKDSAYAGKNTHSSSTRHSSDSSPSHSRAGGTPESSGNAKFSDFAPKYDPSIPNINTPAPTPVHQGEDRGVFRTAMHHLGRGIQAVENFGKSIFSQTVDNTAVIAEYGWNELERNNPGLAQDIEKMGYKAADFIKDVPKHIDSSVDSYMDAHIEKRPVSSNTMMKSGEYIIESFGKAGKFIGDNVPEFVKDYVRTSTPEEMKVYKYLGLAGGVALDTYGPGKLSKIFRFDKIEVPKGFDLDYKTYTASELNNMPGQKKGLVFMLESPRGNKDAIDFHAGTVGAMSDPDSKKFIVPALRYDNPQPRGMDFIKFDGLEISPKGEVLLIDAKRNLPFWTDTGMDNIGGTLDRIEKVLLQNPGYKVDWEFPNKQVADKFADFVDKAGKKGIVGIRIRGE